MHVAQSYVKVDLHALGGPRTSTNYVTRIEDIRADTKSQYIIRLILLFSYMCDCHRLTSHPREFIPCFDKKFTIC